MPARTEVTFDARMLKSSGIGTQVHQVLKILTADRRLKMSLIGRPVDVSEMLPDFNGSIIPWNAPIYSIQEQMSFPDFSGILHCPHYNAPVRHLARAVVVVHDLIHLQSEEFKKPHYRLYAWFMLKKIAKNAKRIITVSEYTRQELVRRFPDALPKTTVLHNGLNTDLFKKQSPKKISLFKEKYSLPEHFFLTVGIGKKHKNIDFVIRSLAPMWKSGQIKEPLVLGGTGGVIPDYVMSEIKKQNIHDYIYVMPFLQEDELPLLYSSADIFLMPSLLEGFGLPVIEAMACGTPVFCSDAASLPEIAGDAASYFDPMNTVSFQSGFLALYSSRKEKEALVKKGYRQAKKFSWKKHAEALAGIYSSL